MLPASRVRRAVSGIGCNLDARGRQVIRRTGGQADRRTGGQAEEAENQSSESSRALRIFVTLSAAKGHASKHAPFAPLGMTTANRSVPHLHRPSSAPSFRPLPARLALLTARASFPPCPSPPSTPPRGKRSGPSRRSPPSELEARLACADSAFRRHRRTTFAERGGSCSRPPRSSRPRRKRSAGSWHRDGQADQAARRGGGKCALRLPLLRRERRAVPGRRAGRDRAPRSSFVALPAARAGARGHAVELPVLAGVPLRRAGAHGRQRRPAQARVERAAVRARDRGHLPARRLPRGRLPDAADRVRPASKRVIEDPRVAAVTLTGSDQRRAAHVASARGQGIKKTVLELGGSDPFIVMPSADLDAAVRTAVKARDDQQRPVLHRGQALHRGRVDRRRVRARSSWRGCEALKVGDPMDAATDVGPLATENQVLTTRRAGASARSRRAPGSSPAASGSTGPGFYYAPTVLTDVTPDSPAYHEELFGPVAIAVPRAGRGRGDPARERLALRARRERLDQRPGGAASGSSTEIEAGMVFINAHGGLRSAAAVRRREALAATAASSAARDPRVREHQDRLGAGDGPRRRRSCRIRSRGAATRGGRLESASP